ncbi:hypothetical protein CPter91_4733 [Collimonas pratensis]|uniref:Uncharacterized protein n=1 Tax=Collimonas pratensis TaxID=279113 RepID=A0A127QBN2_9BURK|nr:hypothetical protein CPter91_4733 [Collimonas pratensis]
MMFVCKYCQKFLLFSYLLLDSTTEFLYMNKEKIVCVAARIFHRNAK